MREERIATLEQMEAISMRMLEASFEQMAALETHALLALEGQMERTIDHTFARLTALLIGIGIAVALVLVLGTWVYITKIRMTAS